MNEIYHLLLALQVMTVAVLIVTGSSFCPVQNHTDTPQFTTKLGAEDWVRVGHLVAIPCCSEGYEDISWYRKEAGTWTPFPPSTHGDYDAPDVQENGQVLYIKSAQETDETTYKCEVIKDTHVSLVHETTLKVVHCDKMAQGPIAMYPSPQNTTIDEYGGTITWHCKGYFGCTDSRAEASLNLVWWRVWGRHEDVQNISSRYNVVTTESLDHSTKDVSLTIKNVQQIDTERKFLCELISDQEYHGQLVIPVHITKRDKPTIPWMIIGLSIGGGLVFILFIVWLRCMYGPRIRLFVNSRFPSLGPKLIDEETYDYNLYIHHAAEDVEYASDLREKLTELEYRVFISDDVKSGMGFVAEIMEVSQRSAAIVVVFSNNLLVDRQMKFALQTLVEYREGKGITILEVSHYEADAVIEEISNKNNTENGILVDDGDADPAIMNRQNLVINTAISIQEKDGDDNNVDVKKDDTAPSKAAEGDMEDKTTDQHAEKVVNDLKYWKVLPRIKVPKENASSRIKTNFLCCIQNKIPKFKKQSTKSEEKTRGQRRPERREHGRNSSSAKPLLESPPISPEFSPNTDNVFGFDVEVPEDHNNTAIEEPANNFLVHNSIEAGARQIDNDNEVNAHRPDNSRRGNELIPDYDFHHRQVSEPLASKVPSTEDQSVQHAGETHMFVMSGEEPRITPGSLNSNSSGYGEEMTSDRETELMSSNEQYQSSTSGAASSFDNRDERSSPPEYKSQVDALSNADDRKLPLHVNKPNAYKTGTASSPESGCFETTSPIEGHTEISSDQSFKVPVSSNDYRNVKP